MDSRSLLLLALALVIIPSISSVNLLKKQISNLPRLQEIAYDIIADTERANQSVDPYSPGLWVSEGSTVLYIHPDELGNKTMKKLFLPLHSVQILKVAYDSISNVLYIADAKVPAIRAMNMTTQLMWELVKDNLISPEDMALHDTNLYWIDSTKGTVEVIYNIRQTAGVQQQRATLVEGLSIPLSIAISRHGYIFIASLLSQFVWMYDLDGKNPKQLSSVGGYTVCIAVHPTKSLLYWADLQTETISFTNFTTISTSHVVASGISGVMSVVSSEDSVYWTTRDRNIYRNILNSNITHVYALKRPQSPGAFILKITYSPGLQVEGFNKCADDFMPRNGTCEPAPKITSTAVPMECPKDYCLGGGLCTVENGKFSCKCTAFFTGTNCEVEIPKDHGWSADIASMTVTGIIVLVHCVGVGIT